MHNMKIEKKVVADINFSASQWGLLTFTFDRDIIEGVADQLNRALEDWVNNGYGLKETREGMYELLEQNSKYGAFDTEPRSFLEAVLEEIFR